MTEIEILHSGQKITKLTPKTTPQTINDTLSPDSTKLASPNITRKLHSRVNYDIFTILQTNQFFILAKHFDTFFAVSQSEIVHFDLDFAILAQIQFPCESPPIQVAAGTKHLAVLLASGFVHIFDLYELILTLTLPLKYTSIAAYDDKFLTGNSLSILKIIAPTGEISAQIPLGIGQITSLSYFEECFYVSSYSGTSLKLDSNLVFHSRDSRNLPVLFYNQNVRVYVPDIVKVSSLTNCLAECVSVDCDGELSLMVFKNGTFVVQEKEVKPYICAQVQVDKIDLNAKQILQAEKTVFMSNGLVFGNQIVGIGKECLFKFKFVRVDETKQMHSEGKEGTEKAKKTVNDEDGDVAKSKRVRKPKGLVTQE